MRRTSSNCDPKDGATMIDYFSEFAITPAAEVNFDLAATSPGSGALRKLCQAPTTENRSGSFRTPNCTRVIRTPCYPRERAARGVRFGLLLTAKRRLRVI